jgi:hypothetical protein
MICPATPEELVDILVQGIRTGRRPDLDRALLAEELRLSPEALNLAYPDQDALFVHAVRTVLKGFDGLLLCAATSPARNSDQVYLWSSVPAEDAPRREQPEPKAAALMLLILCNDAALREAQRVFDSWQLLASECAGDPVDGTLARVLGDGWWFSHAFGLGDQLDPAGRGALRQRLAKITGSKPINPAKG